MISGIGSAIPSIGTQLGTTGSNSASSPGTASSFSDVFQSAVGSVDSLQTSADKQVVNMLQGSGNADMSKTMVSVEKADVAFQLMMQVRNKIVSAYQEMEKMQF
jgi:flagellar hook-basal body complex protein FliE